MPEIPEMQALTNLVTRDLVGHEIERFEIAQLSALKTYKPSTDDFKGAVIEGASRRGKYLQIKTTAGYCVIHLSRGGWVQFNATTSDKKLKLGKGPMSARLAFTDGTSLSVTEAGKEKRLSIWLVNDPDEIENVRTLGPEPLADDFDVAALREVLAGAGRTALKNMLINQRTIAGIGNAWSDEILHLAKLSPFKPSNKLSDDEIETLFNAVRDTLNGANERLAGESAKDLKDSKRAELRVHARAGEKCVVCGDTIRSVFYVSKHLEYCPTCQTGGKVLADRRLSRLLK